MNVHLLVLVSGDGGEDGLGEAEGLDPFAAGHGLVGGQLAAEVLPDDVDARLVLVHGVEDDLGAAGERKVGLTRLVLSAQIHLTFLWVAPVNWLGLVVSLAPEGKSKTQTSL